jgi:hypothetical protein
MLMRSLDAWPEEEELFEDNDFYFMTEQWELFQKNRTGKPTTLEGCVI